MRFFERANWGLSIVYEEHIDHSRARWRNPLPTRPADCGPLISLFERMHHDSLDKFPSIEKWSLNSDIGSRVPLPRETWMVIVIENDAAVEVPMPDG